MLLRFSCRHASLMLDTLLMLAAIICLRCAIAAAAAADIFDADALPHAEFAVIIYAALICFRFAREQSHTLLRRLER